MEQSSCHLSPPLCFVGLVPPASWRSCLPFGWCCTVTGAQRTQGAVRLALPRRPERTSCTHLARHSPDTRYRLTDDHPFGSTVQRISRVPRREVACGSGSQVGARSQLGPRGSALLPPLGAAWGGVTWRPSSGPTTAIGDRVVGTRGSEAGSGAPQASPPPNRSPPSYSGWQGSYELRLIRATLSGEAGEAATSCAEPISRSSYHGTRQSGGGGPGASGRGHNGTICWRDGTQARGGGHRRTGRSSARGRADGCSSIRRGDSGSRWMGRGCRPVPFSCRRSGGTATWPACGPARAASVRRGRR
jgi:hypothetical protein